MADIAKKREDIREADKIASTPKEYKAKDPSTEMAVKSIENDGVYVVMPISKVAWTAMGSHAPILGMETKVAAEALAGVSVVDFEGNNDEVLRVRVSILKATPTVKMTKWGTRVVDKVDSSFSFPMGVESANNSIAAAKVQFRAFFTGAGAGVLGNRAGNYAELIYRGKILDKFVKNAA